MTDPLSALSDYYTPGQAARILGITTNYLSDLAKSGRITPHPVPGGRLYAKSDVEELGRARATRAASGPQPGRPTKAVVAARAITTPVHRPHRKSTNTLGRHARR